MTVFHRASIGVNGSELQELVDAEVSHEFLDRIPGGIFRYRAEGDEQIDYVNSGLIRMFGCQTYEEFIELTGNTFPGMIVEEDRKRVQHEVRDQVRLSSEDQVRFRIRRKDGEVRWIEDNGQYVVDSEGTPWFYVTLLDVTEEVRLQAALAEANEKYEMLAILGSYQRQAEVDGLTGVFNRAAGVTRITEQLAKGGLPCSFIIIDVDDFKGVNDNYGHPAGDRVLMALARHLRSTVRGGDVVARFGGDEFVVFARGLGSGDALEGLIGRLSRDIFRGRRVTDPGIGIPEPSISIGVATTQDGSADFERLYAAADRALYQAKTAGKSCAELVEV